MAGKLIADQIEHSTAGSLDTSYVVNGSAKAWVNFNGTGTIAARDSLNLSSLTDLSTGTYQINFSNAFTNGNYANVGALGSSGRIYPNDVLFTHPDQQNTTDSRVFNCSGNGTAADRTIIICQITGDLA
jgi:hypothetical protein